MFNGNITIFKNLDGHLPHGSIRYHAAIGTLTSRGMSGAVGWLHEMVANELTPDVMAYTAPQLTSVSSWFWWGKLEDLWRQRRWWWGPELSRCFKHFKPWIEGRWGCDTLQCQEGQCGRSHQVSSSCQLADADGYGCIEACITNLKRKFTPVRQLFIIMIIMTSL